MKKGHLTLVDGATSHRRPPAPRRLSTDRQGQFQLELKDGDVRHILIVAMDAVHGSRVATAVEKTLPVTVVDARRVFGRLDFLAEPVGGRGRAWVAADRVRLEGGPA